MADSEILIPVRRQHADTRPEIEALVTKKQRWGYTENEDLIFVRRSNLTGRYFSRSALCLPGTEYDIGIEMTAGGDVLLPTNSVSLTFGTATPATIQHIPGQGLKVFTRLGIGADSNPGWDLEVAVDQNSPTIAFVSNANNHADAYSGFVAQGFDGNQASLRAVATAAGGYTGDKTLLLSYGNSGMVIEQDGSFPISFYNNGVNTVTISDHGNFIVGEIPTLENVVEIGRTQNSGTCCRIKNDADDTLAIVGYLVDGSGGVLQMLVYAPNYTTAYLRDKAIVFSSTNTGLIIEQYGAFPIDLRTGSATRMSIKGAGTINITLASLPIYANNVAALAGGLVAGDLYRTNGDPDPVSVVH